MDNAPCGPPHGWCGRGRTFIRIMISMIIVIAIVVCTCTSTSTIDLHHHKYLWSRLPFGSTSDSYPHLCEALPAQSTKFEEIFAMQILVKTLTGKTITLDV